MNDEIKNIIKNNNKEITKTQKVYHSSFSNNNLFNKDDTFTEFDFKSYGSFHAACEVEGSDFGKQVAENRVSVKILEDASNRVHISDNLLNEIINEREVDFHKLKEETGYEVTDKFRNPIMIEAEISYTNAITLNENRTGKWTPYDIIREVINKLENGEDVKGFTENDIDDFYTDEININGIMFMDLINEPYGDEEFNQDYKEFLFVRDWLEERGYDAVKYENTFEGNSECIISMKSENIKITDSYCLKSLIDLPELDRDIKRRNRLKP